MEKWTVILRTPHGLRFEVVDANIADLGDDEKYLEFYDIGAASDVLDALQGAGAKGLEGKSPDQARSEVMRLVRSLGKIRVTQIERESVIGYFMGLRANVDIDLTPREG